MAHSLNRGPPRQAAAQSFPRSATVRLALERRAARGAPVETERAAPSWWTTVAQAAHCHERNTRATQQPPAGPSGNTADSNQPAPPSPIGREAPSHPPRTTSASAQRATNWVFARRYCAQQHARLPRHLPQRWQWLCLTLRGAQDPGRQVRTWGPSVSAQQAPVMSKTAAMLPSQGDRPSRVATTQEPTTTILPIGQVVLTHGLNTTNHNNCPRLVIHWLLLEEKC